MSAAIVEDEPTTPGVHLPSREVQEVRERLQAYERLIQTQERQLAAAQRLDTNMVKMLLPPEYAGTSDTQINGAVWLENAYDFLVKTNLRADIRGSSFLATRLTGGLKTWFYAKKKSHPGFEATPETLLEHLKGYLNLGRLAMEARIRMEKLRQTGSVEVYLRKFEEIALVIEDLTDGEKLARFVSGSQFM
jgi:hypothetical protein